MHYDKDIILSQYEHAINLYTHEDQLNWSKINHFFYITGGLYGIISILSNVMSNNSFYFSVWIASILGIISSYLFYVTISSGVDYMQRRKEKVIEIEKILVHLKGLDIVSINFNNGDQKYKKSPTTKIMKIIPKFILSIWFVIFVITLLIVINNFFAG